MSFPLTLKFWILYEKQKYRKLQCFNHINIFSLKKKKHKKPQPLYFHICFLFSLFAVTISTLSRCSLDLPYKILLI